MTAHWKIIKLGDAIKLEYGKPLPDEDRDDAGAYPAYGANGVKCRTNKFYFAKPSIIVGRKGSAGELTLTDDKFWPLDVTYYMTFDERQYDLKFLYHCLSTLQLTGMAKGVKPGLNRNDVYCIEVAFPPLAEQKRIVAILDEAFDGIAAAKANAEKNLANARELFESYLNSVFTIKGKTWTVNKLEDLCELISGQHIDAKDYNFNSRGIGYLTGPSDFGILNPIVTKWTEVPKRTARKNDILITVKGSGVGKINLLDAEELAISRQLMAVRATHINTKFLYAFLSLQFNYFQSLANGAAIPGISRKDVLDLEIPVPCASEQTLIVSKIEEINLETERLELVYQQNLTSLAELKQSILQKAFAGELTAQKTDVIDTCAPEFTAYVLAFSYDQHLLKRHEKTFGHVKAQKTLHLFESIAGIDLGRNPIKDAAGPNDFQHMLRAERWAKENQFFAFVGSKDKGYEFKKLTRYDEMIEQCSDAIKPYNEQLKKVIDLVLPMNSQQAEVFATVHAAWNNLVIDQIETTDQNIIREARENWHAEKLRIREKEFKNAIRFIRDKGLVPDGSAKRVGGQGSLPL